ncbi:MAG: hypothetical protein QOE99_277 [Actinomycetota bacterium]|jgi:CobQ-like glutamine amidotransferase family enzyme|nr:hypothetical protein [Actinomycetota bacterium]
MSAREPRGQSVLRIVSLFPALLGTYGDGGNVLILAQRARWRGQAVEVISVDGDDPVPSSGDIYVIGGGEDGSQLAAMAALTSNGRQASQLGSLAGHAQILAVCAGLQLLGEWFLDGAGDRTPGLGLLDAQTSRLRRRAVGEVIATPAPSLGLPVLSGFENHAGHTVLGPGVQPLATVVRGTGNGPSPTGAPATEGALTGSIIGTYLHGPLLARNPDLADLLIARATGGTVAQLSPVDVPEHAALRKRLGVAG